MESLKKLEDMGYSIKVKKSDVVLHDYSNESRLIFDYKSGTISDLEEVEKTIREIRLNEKKVINFLDERTKKENYNAALKHNYLSYSYDECYGKQLTNNSFIFIQKILDSKVWTSYRITYNEFLNIASDKDIIESDDFIEVINRTEKYIKNYIDFIKG